MKKPNQGGDKERILSQEQQGLKTMRRYIHECNEKGNTDRKKVHFTKDSVCVVVLLDILIKVVKGRTSLVWRALA